MRESISNQDQGEEERSPQKQKLMLSEETKSGVPPELMKRPDSLP